MPNPRFPNVIRAIIIEYTASWRLLPWISENEINWRYLGKNQHPAALDLMHLHMDKAIWTFASANPIHWPWLKNHPEFIDIDFAIENTNSDAFEYIVANLHRTQWTYETIASNPIMIPWLTTQYAHGYVSWNGLCRNEAAQSMVMAHFDDIDWNDLHLNTAPWALKLCEDNPDKYDSALAANSAGFDLLVKSADRAGKALEDFVDYDHLSCNNDPRAIKLIMTKPLEISWEEFSQLPNAVSHFCNNKHNLDWETLFANPGIFELWTLPGLFEQL